MIDAVSTTVERYEFRGREMVSIVAGVAKAAAMVLLVAALAGFGFSQGQQKSSSIVIHDTTTAGNGGEGATANLRNEFKSALASEKPCVETMDDQDIQDAIQDERDRALLEGGDSTAALKMLGERMSSSLVMSVQATPGASGSTVYTAFVMDTRSATTISRETGTGSAKQIAESLVRSLSPYLADNCTPHWAGTIRYVFSSNESKQKTDAGAMRAASRNMKRTTTETSSMTTTIKATLLNAPGGAASASANSTKARVMQRSKLTIEKKANTSGEIQCRPRGQSTFWKGFSESTSETLTQIGQGTDTMPVLISFDGDGSYGIKVSAPAGVVYGKLEKTFKTTRCEDEPIPSIESQELPEGRLEPTGFDANGRTDSKKPDVLAGSETSPDGRTQITWNLRLVRPKGMK